MSESWTLLGGTGECQTYSGGPLRRRKSIHAYFFRCLEESELAPNRFLGICSEESDDDGVNTFKCGDEAGVIRVVDYTNFGLGFDGLGRPREYDRSVFSRRKDAVVERQGA